jgi:hypothetical protein
MTSTQRLRRDMRADELGGANRRSFVIDGKCGARKKVAKPERALNRRKAGVGRFTFA